MAEMRTWTADEARAAVAEALKNWTDNNWYVTDLALNALGIDGDVTLVPGRLEQVGIGEQRIGGSHRVKVFEGIDELVDEGDFFVYRVVPHAEPEQP